MSISRFVKPPFRFLHALILAGLIFLGILAILLFIPSEKLRPVLTDGIYPIINLLATIALFYAARRSFDQSKRLGLAWGVIALAQFIYTLANLAWWILEAVLNRQPFPSVADGFYLAYYPLFLVGVLLLPKMHFSRKEWLETALDLTIVMLAAIFGVWNYLLGPMALSSVADPWINQVLTLAYPVGDLILFWALLMLLYRKSPQQNQGPLYLLAAGMVAMIVTDCIFGYQSLSNTYESSWYLDLGYVLVYLLSGLAGVLQAETVQRDGLSQPSDSPANESQGKSNGLLSYFPYLWIGVAFILLVQSEDNILPMNFETIAIGVEVIIGLVIVRQIIALKENARLFWQLHQTMERVQQQSIAFEETSQKLDAIISASPLAIDALDSKGKVTLWSPAAERLFGWKKDEVIGKKLPIIPDNLRDEENKQIEEQIIGINRTGLEAYRQRKDGSLVNVSISSGPLRNAQGQITGLMAILVDNTERLRAEWELERRLAELEALHAVALAGIESTSLNDLIEKVTSIIVEKLYPDDFGIAFLDEETCVLNMHPSARTQTGVHFPPIPLDHGIMGAVARDRIPRRVGDVRTDPDYLEIDPAVCSDLCVPLIIGDHLIGVINTESSHPDAYSEADEGLLVAAAGELGIAIEKVRLFEAERDRRHELEMLAEVSAAMRTAKNHKEILPIVLNHIMGLLDAQGAAIAMCDPLSKDTVFELGYGEWRSLAGVCIPCGAGIGEVVLTSRQAYVSEDIANDPLLVCPDVFGKIHCLVCLPLIAEEQAFGLLYIGRNFPFTPADVQLAKAIADMAASAFHRAQLHDETERNLQRLTILRSIDQTILTSQDLGVTLDVLLGQITAQMGVDAGNILLYQSGSQTLEIAALNGLHSPLYRSTTLRLGESHAGQVALERKMELISDLGQVKDSLVDLIRQSGEGFVGYVALPLVARGEIKGVLQLFQRTRLEPKPDWIDFLQALANQAAIAIDNSQLFEQQQQLNLRLSLAYDNTIDGWSRALDLRDRETEGHSQRVTELTLQLARRLSIPQEQIPHIRRGAQLHDIGKMGIPDNILLKPGPLTNEEWEIMRRHPQYAYDLLSPIVYLYPALDIPYCHHEKWDGSGYPRGLKGEQIPLAARIFAVVDVWDALCHDRPYRPAWEKEKIVAYILDQSGKQFDPDVVKAFLHLTEEEKGYPPAIFQLLQ